MDYCVQCWERNRQRVAATKTVEDDPLCDVHAKEAGWEPALDSVLKVETPLGTMERCRCGKPLRHKGRCLGFTRSIKPDPALTAVTKLRSEGKSVRAIASELSVCRTTAGRLAQQAESILTAPNAAPYVTLTVTEAALDNFWMKLPVSEKAKIVEGMLR